MKGRTAGPPMNKATLGQLRKIRFDVPVMVTLKMKKKKMKQRTLPQNAVLTYQLLPPKAIIPYSRVLNVINYIRQQLADDDEDLFTECIGYRLLATRASTNMFEILDAASKEEINDL